MSDLDPLVVVLNSQAHYRPSGTGGFVHGQLLELLLDQVADRAVPDRALEIEARPGGVALGVGIGQFVADPVNLGRRRNIGTSYP